jgi:hypothetical protein
MSKADQQAAKSQAQQQITANKQFQQQTGEQLQSILGGYQSQAGSILPSVISGYSDIASTGGISPGDIAAIQSRASESARSAYDVGASQAQRASAATGGYGTSGSIANTLARQGSQAASRASVDTSASLAGLLSQNKLAAIGGLSNVYGLTENEINHTINAILQNYQMTGQLNNQDLAILTNLANQPGVFDKIVGTIGTLGGAAAGVLSGVGSITNPRPRVVGP